MADDKKKKPKIVPKVTNLTAVSRTKVKKKNKSKGSGKSDNS